MTLGIAFLGAQDRAFTVTVSNILVNGSPQTQVYSVVLIDPAVVTGVIFSDGFESGGLGFRSQTVP